jgi:hypothetical protein
METIPVYVEAFPEREAVLNPEGEEIELPPEKEEELPSMLERVETEEDSPPSLEEVLMFLSFLKHCFHERILIYQVWSNMT